MVAFFGSKHYNRAKENLKDKKKLMNYSKEEKEYFMLEALKEARIALELQRAVMHAEIMAIEEANQHENSWRLLDTTLFVTIEPCVMCSGAIGLARIPHVVYGASNQKFGAAGSLYDILTDERLNHRVEVETGVLQEECAQIMQDFFRNRRQK